MEDQYVNNCKCAPLSFDKGSYIDVNKEALGDQSKFVFKICDKQDSQWIGRNDDMVEVMKKLIDNRNQFVTINGSNGVGKRYTAIQLSLYLQERSNILTYGVIRISNLDSDSFSAQFIQKLFSTITSRDPSLKNNNRDLKSVSLDISLTDELDDQNVFELKTICEFFEVKKALILIDQMPKLEESDTLNRAVLA